MTASNRAKQRSENQWISGCRTNSRNQFRVVSSVNGTCCEYCGVCKIPSRDVWLASLNDGRRWAPLSNRRLTSPKSYQNATTKNIGPDTQGGPRIIKNSHHQIFNKQCYNRGEAPLSMSRDFSSHWVTGSQPGRKSPKLGNGAFWLGQWLFFLLMF